MEVNQIVRTFESVGQSNFWGKDQNNFSFNWILLQKRQVFY